MSTMEFESKNLPFGEPIPDTPHAVSVSLPDLNDIAKLFLEHDPEAWRGLKTVYGRFGIHPYNQAVIEALGIPQELQAMVFSSTRAAERFVQLNQTEIEEPALIETDQLAVVSYLPAYKGALGSVNNFSTYTGWVASSRRAEDFLVAAGLQDKPFPERVYSPQMSKDIVVQELQRPYTPSSPEVILANSGMSAIYAALEGIEKARNVDVKDEAGRYNWLVVGNLYHDTEVLFASLEKGKPHIVRDVNDLKGMKAVLEMYGHKLAGVICEVPTNPLMHTPPVSQIKELIGDIPLLVDVSTASSELVDLLPYADVILESLTKTPSGKADVLMGAIILSPNSPYHDALKENTLASVEPPYIRDVQRMAYEIMTWRERVQRSGRNVVALVEFFESHKKINQINWSGSSPNQEHYAAVARSGSVPPGLITIETATDLGPIYSKLDLARGLSFGTDFTLNTAYVHITYARRLADAVDRRELYEQTGLNDRKLRISVGNEDPDWLIDKYSEALG